MTRLPTGGRVDRGRTLRFTFDGEQYTGHPGDTLASALLAAGRIEAGRSVYRGRPRGVLTADTTEPNAVVQLLGDCPEPMLPATAVELVDGLAAESLSGIGWLGSAPDTAVHDKKYVHADVVVVGAGPAGIAAALAAGRSGARVVLVEQDGALGGALLDGGERVDGRPASEWINRAVREFVEMPEVRVLTRATAVGLYDQNYLLVAERRERDSVRARLWHIRARRVVLATGAHERPMVFADNDRPGTMLASAVRTYLNRFAVLPGTEAVVCTTSDSAYLTALDLVAAGAQVHALVDTRQDPPPRLAAQVREAGVDVHPGSAVVGTTGDRRLTSARVAGIDESGAITGGVREIACDLLAVCGGWSPAVHLHGQAGGKLRWDRIVAGFVPDGGVAGSKVIGAARGTYDLAGCLAQGFAAGAEAATAGGFRVAAPPVPPVDGDRPATATRPLWIVPGETGDPSTWRTHFVDLQRDSTVADVWRSVGAGMRSVEHVKRYTTIGTGSDQGATSSVNAIGVLAEALRSGSPGEVGTTTFRPPANPVSFAMLAGRDRGALHDPARTTPMHSWHVRAGAVFEDVGQWKRARYYPLDGEDMDTAVERECRAAREGVAMMDATTLGKIEVAGPDAATFLNRVYTNAFAKLPVGKARYGMMCGADGMVLDDGVSLRLAEDRYLMTTTTGNAAKVLDWLEEWLQTEWPHLAVHCTSVTEQWATIAVAGPDSRAVVGRMAPALDVSAEAFGFMEFRDTVLHNGIPARICRISFSGELAYEINVASWYGLAVWEAVAEAGAGHGITPYGTETMHVLRAEKGFVIVGQDTDGTVTPHDLGMDWVVSKRKDFVGRRSFARPDTAREDRKQLVGLLPVDPAERLPEGAQLVAPDAPAEPPVPMLGHVTSSYRSAALGRTFALALVADGRRRVGEVVHAPVGDRTIAAVVTRPVFYDEEGARRDGRQPG
ncbi:(2Fe-2S)-binding protein [Saccharopolyspora erythraea]|uniref:2Fe-2S iron-sulfur cluster-binding protein n=1 Tax=Saccharopolyspora erythraea TaxID=1836 RepID=UPI001BA7EFDD|nr:2Fe-2S iron-sulfur cluster-binding protein [Saccharopolyspora erythraea]QUH00678.1 (2Fe-2S)-binding protein [Saccharopolyspora erythraea]